MSSAKCTVIVHASRLKVSKSTLRKLDQDSDVVRYNEAFFMTITCNVLCGINNQEIILVTKCVTYFLTDTKRTMHEI